MKTKNFSKKEAQLIVDWFLNQRLSNYGYNFKTFQRLSSMASSLRQRMRFFRNEVERFLMSNQNEIMGGRLYVDKTDKKVRYVVGQSFNEEYINMMMIILEKSGVYKPKNKNWYY